MSFTSQFSNNTDAKLNALSVQLTETEAERDKALAKYDLLFVQVFDLFSQEVGAEASTRFIADNGYKLARIVPVLQPKVNMEILEKTIQATFAPEIAKKIWNRVTSVQRVVNQDKLAMELVSNPTLEEELQKSGAVIQPVRKPSRIHKELSKKEKALLNAGQELPEESAAWA